MNQVLQLHQQQIQELGCLAYSVVKRNYSHLNYDGLHLVGPSIYFFSSTYGSRLSYFLKTYPCKSPFSCSALLPSQYVFNSARISALNQLQTNLMFMGPCIRLHKDTTPPQPHCNGTPTHTEPDTTHEITTNQSQAPEDGRINGRNMLSIE